MSSIRLARLIFGGAAIYGLIVLPPFYFAEPLFARGGAPLTHPEHFYGFVGAAATMQLVYLMIARDPLRYRPLMPVGTLAKLAFFVPAVILFAQGRAPGPVLAFATVDLLLGLAFMAAWRRTREAA